MSELTTLHQAITATIKTAMPELASVDAYVAVDSSTALPALFHSITALRPAADPGDGRASILATFEARLHVDAADTQAPLRPGWRVSDRVGSADVHSIRLEHRCRVQRRQAGQGPGQGQSNRAGCVAQG